MDTSKIVGSPGVASLIVGLYKRRKEVVYPTSLSCHICNYDRLKDVLGQLEELGVLTVKREEENSKNLNVSLTPLGKEVAKILIKMDRDLQKVFSNEAKSTL